MDETMRNAPIGDDGRYMTKARVRLHRLLNGLLVWAIVCIVAAVGFTIAAYFQGQTYEDLELIASGGTVFNGHSVAGLMRMEAIYCFVSGVLFVVAHLTSFVWFYEKGGGIAPLAACAVAAVLAVAWLCYLASVGTFDIIACASIVMILVVALSVRQVNAEAAQYSLEV